MLNESSIELELQKTIEIFQTIELLRCMELNYRYFVIQKSSNFAIEYNCFNVE